MEYITTRISDFENRKAERPETVKVHDWNEVEPQDIMLDIPMCYKRGKWHASYYNYPCAFDIETSTVECAEPYGILYHWQFAFGKEGECVVFGRSYDTLISFFEKLSKDLELSVNKRLVVYVHFLSYEFQFLKNFITIENQFSKDVRKPLYVLTRGGIEFRCSYFLSNMGLYEFTRKSKNCKYIKLDGEEYDYKKLRTPKTPLDNYEKSYCYNDVRGLVQAVTDFMDEGFTMANIPLTSTGFVRKEVQALMRKNTKNRYNFVRTQLTPELYKLFKETLSGGTTHANRIYVGKILENVQSFDKKSSYPHQMMVKNFPVEPFTAVHLNSRQELEYYNERYCTIGVYTFENLRLRPHQPIPYLSLSKCRKITYGNVNKSGTRGENTEYLSLDNGKIYCCKMCIVPLLNLDYEIIRQVYEWDRIYVEDFYISEPGKLSTEQREACLLYFDRKTQLDGVDDYLYMKSKNKLNGQYGMTISDIVHSQIIFKDDLTWKELKPDEEAIAQGLKDFYSKKQNVLIYQQGVYVPAWARYELYRGIQAVGMDCVYCDTDSVKCVGDHISDMEKLNKSILAENADNDMRTYSERDGKKYELGCWEHEYDYERFRTWGAKKYAYDKEGKFGITVAGMSKEYGARAIGCLENFELGAKFENVGRTVAYYNDCPTHTVVLNGETITVGSNVGTVDTTYTLGVTELFESLFLSSQEKMKKGIDIIF